VEIVAVSEELIRLTPELAEQLDRRHRVPDLRPDSGGQEMQSPAVSELDVNHE